MNWKMFFFATFFASLANAGTLHCSYQYMGMPVWSITYFFEEDGTPGPDVEVLLSGAPHKEPLAVIENQANELLHGWISKDSPQNSLEVFIYKDRQAQGLTKLINPRMPVAKEVWGDCQ